MIKIVVVNGRPGCGKTTFEKICIEYCYHKIVPGFLENDRVLVDICSTVDIVKEIAATAGWDGTKTEKNRKFLSDLKALLAEWNDIPVQSIIKRIGEIEKLCKNVDVILMVDSREPNEI